MNKPKFSLASLSIVSLCFVLIVFGQAIAYWTINATMLLLTVKLDLLGIVTFLRNMPYYGIVPQVIGIIILGYYAKSRKFAVDQSRSKRQLKTFAVVALLSCFAFTSALGTIPIVKANAIATTNYFLDTPLPIADFYVGKYSNSSYFAINGSNWDNFVVSTNASYIINTCIQNLPYGGSIKLGYGNFTLDSSIQLFKGGAGEELGKTWKIQGDGSQNTALWCNTAGVAAVHIRNNTKVELSELAIDAYGSYALLADEYGSSSEASMCLSTFRDLDILGTCSESMMKLTNFMNCVFENVHVRTLGNGIDLEANSTTIQYGNSVFTNCAVSISDTGEDNYGWKLNSTSSTGNILNLLHFNRLESVGQCNVSCYIGSYVQMVGIDDIDLEGGKYALYLGNAGYGEITVNNGYLSGSTWDIYNAGSGYNFWVKNVVLAQGASTDYIYDQAGWMSSHYEDIYLGNAGTGDITAPYAHFSGSAGANKLFSGYFAFTDKANASYVTLGSSGLWGTPSIVTITLAENGYAWYGTVNATHVQIYFSGNTSATVSGSLFAGWQP